MIKDPMKGLPGYALRRVSAANMSRLAARLARLNLRPAEATVLLVIQDNPGVKQSEIGRLLGVVSANMAPLVGRLADRGLIIRQAVDGRSQGLTLTGTGRSTAQKARGIMDDVEADLLSHIPKADCAVFVRVLHTLANQKDD